MIDEYDIGYVCKLDINKSFDELHRYNTLNHIINKIDNYKFIY